MLSIFVFSEHSNIHTSESTNEIAELKMSKSTSCNTMVTLWWPPWVGSHIPRYFKLPLWWLKKTYRDAVAARHFLRLILELLPDIAQDHVNLRSHHTPSENHLGPGNHSEFTVASWRAGACYRCMMPGVMKTTAAKRQTYHDHPIQSAVHCAVSQQTSKKTNAVKRNIGTHGMRNLLGELNSEHSGNESALLGNGSQVLVSLS